MDASSFQKFGAAALGYAAYLTIAAPLALAYGDMGQISLAATAETYARMPDATTLPGNKRLAVVKNTGVLGIVLQDYAGNPLAHLAPQETLYLWASKTDTAAGTWTADGNAARAVRTFDGLVTQTAQSYTAIASLGAGRAIVFYGQKYKVATFANGAWTLGAERTLTAQSVSASPVACNCGTNKVFVAYGSAYARVISDDGTTHTLGAEWTFTTTGSTILATAAWTTDRVAVVQATKINRFVISGTTVSSQTEEVTLSTVSYCNLTNVGTNKILCTVPGASNPVEAALWTLSGSTVTFGSSIVLVGSSGAASTIRQCSFGTNKALVSFYATYSGIGQNAAIILDTSGAAPVPTYSPQRWSLLPDVLLPVADGVAQAFYRSSPTLISGFPAELFSVYVRQAGRDLVPTAPQSFGFAQSFAFGAIDSGAGIVMQTRETELMVRHAAMSALK